MRIALDGKLVGRCSSGVEVSILNLARSLAQFGKEEYLFYVRRGVPLDGFAGAHFKIKRSLSPDRVRLARILWEQLVLPVVLWRDGVHLLHAPAYVAPFLVRVPLIVTIHDLIALLHPEWCKRTNVLHFRLLLPLSARSAKKIIVPSSATQRDLVSHLGIPEDKIKVVHWGVGENFKVIHEREKLELLRKKYHLEENFILFVGNLEPKKNIVNLIKAFHMLKRQEEIAHKLVIAGSPGWGYKPIFKEVRDSSLEGEIAFTGFIPPEELPCLYNLADLFVFPSLYEGFGLPPLEAMACGLPVVSSNRASLPEVVGEAAVMVDPLDVSGIAKAIKEVLANADLRMKLVERGLERAKLFSWQRAAEETEKLYREVVER